MRLYPRPNRGYAFFTRGRGGVASGKPRRGTIARPASAHGREEAMATRRKGYRNIIRIKHGARETVRDALAIEAAVTLFVNQQEIVTLLCTPSRLEHLAAGYLFSEGIVKSADDIRTVAHDAAGGVVNVELIGNLPPEAEVFEHRALTTGCGRGTMFYALQDQAGLTRVRSDARVAAPRIAALMRNLQERSGLFLTTGAVHSAALAHAHCIVCTGEDLGPHLLGNFNQDRARGHPHTGVALGAHAPGRAVRAAPGCYPRGLCSRQPHERVHSRAKNHDFG